MDEITLDGKTYISSKRAALITGYAKDYVGQLCREGRVEARLVGRSWYVYEASLAAHKTEDGRKAERGEEGRNDLMSGKHLQQEPGRDSKLVTVNLGYGLVGTPVQTNDASDISSKYSLYSEPRYMSEEAAELPKFSEGEEKKTLNGPEPREVTTPEVKIAEMQNAWQEWFSESVPRNDILPERKPEPRVEERYVREEPAPVPVRKLISDIEPQPRAYEPVRVTTEAPKAESPRREHTPRPKSHKKRRHKGSQSYGLVFRASIVAIIILTLSITFVATGFAYSTHIIGTGNIFLDYLSGYTVLIKDNI